MTREFCQKLREQLTRGTVLELEPMSSHTSFRIGGPAELFVQPAGTKEMLTAIRLAREEGVPFFVMGKGSNLLVSDEGYRGMILQTGGAFHRIDVEGDIIRTQAGATLNSVANAAYEHGLTGMECLAGIPGSVGGAVCMNAGAYGGEIRDILLDVDLLKQDGTVETFPADALDLSYRHSIIPERDYVVLSARFGLVRGDRTQIKNKTDELARRRKTKQPLEYPSAGSTFKRPEGYFAGKLIQDAGLKGYTVGGAQVSEKHSGFVINRGDATAQEVVFLIGQVQKRVQQQFGVLLEPEVRMLGFEQADGTEGARSSVS